MNNSHIGLGICRSKRHAITKRSLSSCPSSKAARQHLSPRPELTSSTKLSSFSPQVRLSSTRLKCYSTRHSTDTMDINNSALSSSDPKTQVINQFRQEIAVNNARQLISVRDCFRPVEQPFDMYVCLSCWSTES